MAAGAAGAAPMGPGDAAALEALLGMGSIPMPGGAGPGGLPPEAMGMPPAAPVGPIPGMPSTDPSMIAQLRAADHAALDAAQDAAQAQASMMGTAAAGMGGVVPPMDPASLGAGVPPMPGGMGLMMDQPLPVPGTVAGAYGGPDMGSTESEALAPMPGGLAGELGGAY